MLVFGSDVSTISISAVRTDITDSGRGLRPSVDEALVKCASEEVDRRVSLRGDVFSAHARRPDVSSDDARSSNMSTPERLVSASDNVGRNAQSVWYDIANVKARLEPVDTLSKAFASTLRGLLIEGHLYVAGMSTQSPGPLQRSAADRRDCLVTYIKICIRENPGRAHGGLQVHRFAS